MPALSVLEKLGGIKASSLTQLQRVLIITDGTLSEILEAAFLERIRLVKISQEVVSSTALTHISIPPMERLFWKGK